MSIEKLIDEIETYLNEKGYILVELSISSEGILHLEYSTEEQKDTYTTGFIFDRGFVTSFIKYVLQDTYYVTSNEDLVTINMLESIIRGWLEDDESSKNLSK